MALLYRQTKHLDHFFKAADNTDNNEETLDGKNTTHAASVVVFQRQPNGPEPLPV